ncbi:MAG: hypothetical protein Q9206_005950 [Seirophora lacunosa]
MRGKVFLVQLYIPLQDLQYSVPPMVWAGGGFVSSAPLALKSIETDGCGGVARNDLCLEGEADGGVVVGPGTAGLKVMAREESDS